MPSTPCSRTSPSRTRRRTRSAARSSGKSRPEPECSGCRVVVYVVVVQTSGWARVRNAAAGRTKLQPVVATEHVVIADASVDDDERFFAPFVRQQQRYRFSWLA